jgi:hypothetical protein
MSALVQTKENIMRKTIVFAAAACLGLFTVAAQAMPVTSLNAASDTMITRVAQGCGPGMHRGPHGACRPVFSCPRGWHPGPHGRQCFRNR